MRHPITLDKQLRTELMSGSTVLHKGGDSTGDDAKSKTVDVGKNGKPEADMKPSEGVSGKTNTKGTQSAPPSGPEQKKRPNARPLAEPFVTNPAKVQSKPIKPSKAKTLSTPKNKISPSKHNLKALTTPKKKAKSGMRVNP
jgi:hypothetical protein